MAPQHVKPPETYPLEASPEELQRLITGASLVAEDVRDACRRVGLRAGDKAIDVGCGPAGALSVLAEVVGPRGVVVGLDAEAAVLEMARAILRQKLANVTLIHADVNETDAKSVCPPGPFDLAYCRLFLMHQADPVATLRKIASFTRPGGHIVARDMLEGPRCDPPLPSLERSWALSTELMRRKGGAPDVSRRYGAICREAGLKLINQRGLFPVQAPQDGLEHLRVLFLAGRRSILEYGLSTADEVDALTESLEKAKMGKVHYFFGPLSIEMIAQVP